MFHVNAAVLPDQMLVSAFMASAPDHLYFKDRESRFVAVSNSLAQSLGCTVEEILGKTDADFFDAAQARAYREAELKIMSTGEKLDRVIKHTWADGRETWSINVAMPMRSATGEIIGVFGSNKDITAAKVMEQELERSNAKLREMSRRAGQAEVANNVLHNVGNVLNSVVISAGLIGGKVRDSKSQGLAKAVQLMNEHAADLGDFFTRHDKGKALPDYLNMLVTALAAEKLSIAAEFESLTRSIEHIKDIVATQQRYAGSTNLVEPVQIRDLLEEALRMNAASIQRHQVVVVKEFADVPSLLLDKHLVLQILINLIANAKRAMDGVPDRPHHITLRLGHVEGSGLTIEVEDDGEGIGPEILPRLFGHGFTTRRDGHGFGLHSCALAAKEMGGSITAHSEGPGRGAVFTLQLPVNPAKGTP
jgi:PAS domain S-box-containing protein